MDERVDPIDPCHEKWCLQEICLDMKFPEDVEFLLKSYYLKGVGARCMDGSFDYEDCGGGSAELVYLYVLGLGCSLD